MIVLAIETATLEVGAAIIGRGGTIAVARSRPGRRHVETLHPAIETVLKQSGLRAADIEGVAVDVGPGLFTGLRVGIAAAKALGFALHVPLAAVLCTDALRFEAARVFGCDPSVVVPVVDMRRGELAWSMSDGPLEIGRPAELGERLRATVGDLFLVGDGAIANQRELVAAAGDLAVLHFGEDALAAPSVVAVGELGAARLVSGVATDAVSIEAVYLRAADARANFSTRQETTGRAPL